MNPTACPFRITRHRDALRVLHAPERFRNRLPGKHLSVPNGMDPPEHTEYRRCIEAFFLPEVVASFEPQVRSAVTARLGTMRNGPRELMESLARPLALDLLCAFLAWPLHTRVKLDAWERANTDAAAGNDRVSLTRLARHFQELIAEVLAEKRGAPRTGAVDRTLDLMNARVQNQTLDVDTIASILRNWTAGEIGTLSASIGALCWFLASHPEVAEGLRDGSLPVEPAIDEILRLYPPLLSNRRAVARPMEFHGERLEKDRTVLLDWSAIQHDPLAFAQPWEFCPQRPRETNLLFGSGIHRCPAADLVRMELRVFVEELLSQKALSSRRQALPVAAEPPRAGFASIHVVVSQRAVACGV